MSKEKLASLTLPLHHTRLAVADCLRDNNLKNHSLPAVLRRLWREDPSAVKELYDAAMEGYAERGDTGCSPHGLLAERMKTLRRKPQVRDRRGLTLSEIAVQAGIDQATLTALMEHHGYVELVPYGRDQRRKLVTDQAFDAEYGHNVPPSSSKIVGIDGMNRTAPFPVFYPEVVPSILWSLDLEGVRREVQRKETKRKRIDFAMARHSYLPNATIAALCGCSVRGIEEARTRMTA